MNMFRDFDPFDIDRLQEYLESEEIEWSEHLKAKEYHMVKQQNYFTEIASNGVRYDSSFINNKS